MGTLRSGFRQLCLAMGRTVFTSVRIGAISALLLSGGAVFPMAVNAEAAPPRTKTGGVPFSADDVVQYFTRVLDVPPRRGEQGGTVFDKNNARPEERFRIIVEQENEDVVVSFSAGGDHGMNVIREFFESPLFDRGESEQLYRTLNDADSGQNFRFKRFSVSARAWNTRDRYHLVLRFFQAERPVSLATPRPGRFPPAQTSERNRRLSRFLKQER